MTSGPCLAKSSASAQMNSSPSLFRLPFGRPGLPGLNWYLAGGGLRVLLTLFRAPSSSVILLSVIVGGSMSVAAQLLKMAHQIADQVRIQARNLEPELR